MLQPVLKRDDPLERPDFVLHSYTKDLVGTGTTTAGVAIARNERMFIPKGESVTGTGPDGAPRVYRWDETLFWNVYFVKGAFLDSDKAFEVINGMRTLELRMLRKCINTIVLARTLARHPDVNVNCSAVEGNVNADLCSEYMFLGLPAPLFTFNLEGDPTASPAFGIRDFKRFFDSLEPAFGLQVSLGQVNTVVLCPALTSHSELARDALEDAGHLLGPPALHSQGHELRPRRLPLRLFDQQSLEYTLSAQATVRFMLYNVPTLREIQVVDMQHWRFDRKADAWYVDPDLEAFRRLR